MHDMQDLGGDGLDVDGREALQHQDAGGAR